MWNINFHQRSMRLVRRVSSCSSFRGLPHKASSADRAISPTPDRALDGTHITLPAPRYRTHIAHAVLVALVAVFLARAGTLPTVVPCRNARK
jgi:hypothetical protein